MGLIRIKMSNILRRFSKKCFSNLAKRALEELKKVIKISIMNLLFLKKLYYFLLNVN